MTTKYLCTKCNKFHSANYKKHWKYREKDKNKEATKMTLHDWLMSLPKPEIIKRVEEFMTRLWGNLPNDVMNWSFEQYKAWVCESLYTVNYEDYDDSKEI